MNLAIDWLLHNCNFVFGINYFVLQYMQNQLCLLVICFFATVGVKGCTVLNIEILVRLEWVLTRSLMAGTVCSQAVSETSKKFTSSCPEVSCKKGVLKNFTKFTGKHLCQSFFIDVFAGPRHVTLLKKRLWNRCFLMEFCEIFKRTPFFIEHLR